MTFDIQNKAYLFFLFIILNHFAQAQVGIGTTSPAEGSILDLTSTNKGFITSRVNITDLTTINPITTSGPAAEIGLLVWNTNTTTGVGYHFWDGNDWIPLSNTSSNNWGLTGNTITGGEFLGTINTNDLDIRTDNTERMRIQANGQVSVGFAAAAANANQQFSAVGAVTNDDGIAGYSGGSGFGVYGQNIANGAGVLGLNNSTGDATAGINIGSGVGVYAENSSGNNYSLLANGGFYSIYGFNATLGNDAIVGETDSVTSNGIWGINENASGTGILGGKNGVYVFTTNGSGVAATGQNTGLFAYAGNGARSNANRGNAAGVFDLDTDADPSTTTGNNSTRAYAKLAGFDNLSPDGALAARDSYYGGYFEGGNINGSPSYAYAGIKYNTNNNGTSGTDYKIIGNGTNSTIIRDKNNTPRILFSPEAPEILFEDYGTAKLINGTITINIDPVFSDAIFVDEEHPLKVFIQLEGDCNGVFVSNKSAKSFTVTELANGTTNTPFSWHLVANRADSKENGVITSKHVGLRFPIGPDYLKPLKAQKKELKKAPKAVNNKNTKANIGKKLATNNYRH